MNISRINLVVIGHKDHGKSTLIGRLLYDSKAIQEKKLEDIKTELKQTGKRKFKFAFLLDSLEEERKGGLTIDIMQTPFKSQKYFYTIIDCPGHKEFIKKMLTGASQADAAVLVVSAKEGIQDQTRQHTFLIKTLGIRQLVVAINKMDMVNYKESSYQETRHQLKLILQSLGYRDISMIPISAMKGDNVYKKSKKMEWYKGHTLIEALDEKIAPPLLPLNKPLRGVVQDVYPYEGNRQVIACKIESGVLKPKKNVVFNPSGKTGRLEKILSFGTIMEKAEPGESVGLLINDVDDVERGEVLSYTDNQPMKVKSFIAEVILFSSIQMREGDNITIRYGTAEKKCRVRKIISEIDPVNLTVRAESPKVLKDETVGEVELLALEPVCLEKYSDFPELGRFVIEGKKGTAAAGIVLEIAESFVEA
ncbi:MAG: elongation factor 1-alpha [Candidatus Gerdarchaeota archaeon]|nr:MAG: elongation factor 1-alpha [Candidatus Gerdarchaeota archaeon]